MENRDALLKEVKMLVNKFNLTAYEIGTNINMSITGVQKIISGQTKKPQISTLEAMLKYIISHYTDVTASLSKVNEEKQVYKVEAKKVNPESNTQEILEKYTKTLEKYIEQLESNISVLESENIDLKKEKERMLSMQNVSKH